jgi:lipoate-protein ligase A
VSGLEYLGLAVSVAPEVRLSEMERGNPVCFEVPSSYEIEVDGRKLLGSAQVRRVKGILQHGTLPLEGDVTRIVEVLNLQEEDSRQGARERVKVRAATLSELAGSKVTWEQAAEALRRGFEHALGWHFDEQLPTQAELDRASELKHSRYSNPDWTARI